MHVPPQVSAYTVTQQRHRSCSGSAAERAAASTRADGVRCREASRCRPLVLDTGDNGARSCRGQLPLHTQHVADRCLLTGHPTRETGWTAADAASADKGRGQGGGPSACGVTCDSESRKPSVAISLGANELILRRLGAAIPLKNRGENKKTDMTRSRAVMKNHEVLPHLNKACLIEPPPRRCSRWPSWRRARPSPRQPL